MTQVHPKLFISYSWTSSSHEEWVLSLAIQLRENGIDVILDKWDLKEGYDSHAFMEKMVTDPAIEKVAIICDSGYAEKADGRKGGVGTETQIISAEVYARQEQTKFVAVLPERDEIGNPFLPTYYKSRIYIDLSSPDLYSTNFDQLLRWAYDKPLHKKPELGKAPAFLHEGSTVNLQTTSHIRRTLEAVRHNQPLARGAVIDYFEVFAQNLERFRITRNKEDEFDDKLIQNIEEFLPYRNEATEVFLALARYRPNQESWDAIHKFFERLIPYMDSPKGTSQYHTVDFDNFKFIIHELFLYAVASLVHAECFSGAAHLMRQYYYKEEHSLRGRDPMVPFSDLREHLESLEFRNNRLKLRRLSLHADLLEQRSKSSGLSFQQVMQADLILYIRDCLDVLHSERYQNWWPITLLYAGRQHGPFEVFARSQSVGYFDRVKQLFDVQKKEDFMPLMEAFQKQELKIPRWQFDTFNPFFLMGFDKLSTLP